MAAGKHGPNRFDRYFSIHETVMAKHRADGFVEMDGVVFSDLGDGQILVDGKIHCQGGLCIEVTKMLTVVDGSGATAMVQTVHYSYNVFIRGLGNVFRYCSPHATESSPEHKPYHHKHVFDTLRGDTHGSDMRIDDDGWPTLGGVIDEARDWYNDHIAELEARRSGKKT